MPIHLIYMLGSLGIILTGAMVFTNAIEWLGRKLELPEGAVGSILAAIGTALPETIIPLVAIFLHKGKAEIGVGAILGAPFMLSTLGFFVIGIAMFCSRSKKPLTIDYTILRRDLIAFLLVYWIAILCSFFNYPAFRKGAVASLLCAYLIYVKRTIKSGEPLHGTISSLLFSPNRAPGLGLISFQLVCSLMLIVGGAHLFVENISNFALHHGVSPYLLAAIIAPIATELPEKCNSIFWVRQKKYTMAIGNMTGAMVFQSSVIPVLGILYTPWQLGREGLILCLMSILSALLILFQTRNGLKPRHFMACGLFYLLFIFYGVL